MDESIPEIEFDEQGECNYCKLHDDLDKAFPVGELGEIIIHKFIQEIKRNGRNKKHDCIVGLSGGTDSTYVLHLLKFFGLNPLAVNFDNGWHSEIAVSNIKNAIAKLHVDLETYVVNYEEMKDILLSYMKASLPWVDGPTDAAITQTLYKVAREKKIKYIFMGSNFRTEGRQPTEWTYTDGKQIKFIQKNFGTQKIKSFPNQTMLGLFDSGFIQGIKLIPLLYFVNRKKQEMMEVVEREYAWRYYGGHHYESVFSRFAIAYWLKNKFGIDKRKVTFSALIRTGEMNRPDALIKLGELPYPPEQIEADKEYVIKKLGITGNDFEELMKRPNKTFKDYPSYYPVMDKFRKITNFGLKLILPFKPMISFELKKTSRI